MPSPSFAEKISVPGISNAGKISDRLFRGAQPHVSSLEELKKLGITTIVDLRRESPHTRAEERQKAESLGMRFVSIPVGGFSAPTSAQLAGFFTLLRESPPAKIFVHCEFGENRTGVFIASYRIAFDDWSADQALSEMRAFGFHHFWHPSMATFVRNLPARLRSDPILKSVVPGQSPAIPSRQTRRSVESLAPSRMIACFRDFCSFLRLALALGTQYFRTLPNVTLASFPKPIPPSTLNS